MIFAMALPKRPASAQKRGKKQRYQQEIRDAAISETGGAKLPLFPLFNRELYVRITYFHAKKTALDVDNIPKPILDALIGIVYDNDSQISQCLLTKVSQKDYSLEEKSFLPEVYESFDNLLAQDHEHVLYIEVGPLLSHKVFSGPIESRYT